MPGYHKKKNKQKKAHHNGEPHDHPHKKKEDLKKRLAKISKKVPQDKIRETPTKENNYQTHMDSKGAFEQRALKEKVKKAELTDVTDQQKKKRKDKEKLIHQARGMGVIPTYGKSKVKKTPPQGPSGGTADTPEAIIKDAEAVARKNDTYIGQLKQKIAEKRKRDYQQFKLKEEEKEEIIRENSKKTAQEHDHSITFKGYKGESYKRASLISNTGKYAKYWLLNAKQTNGNGWGVSQQSIAKNIHKFVGKPLVVTAKSWIPDSEYGDAYEHPYLPTNDISKVFDHQEKFRVGSIVDIIEKDGDYFANIELNQKFAHMVMPPFCSPAIFQNNPSEPEGQIEDWEALHLAALHEDPAYGSRIALLRGTCVGTKDQCTVQFKSAKQEAKMVCTKGLKGRIARIKKNEKTSDQAIDDVIKDIKDPDLREDAETRHHHTRPKRLYNHNRKAKLRQRLAEKRSKLPSIGEAWDTLNIGTRERVLNHSGEGGGGIPYKRLMDKDPYRDPHGGKDDFTRIRYVVGDPKKIEVKDINVKKGVDYHYRDGPYFAEYEKRFQKAINTPFNKQSSYLKEGIERGLREQGINHRSEIRPDAPPINLPYGDYGEHETAGMKRDRQRFTKLKQRLSKVRTAKPIIQETGEGITFKKVDPKIYGKKTYGYHKVPMHPSNAILIRPKDPEHYMDLVKHFRKIHETNDFAKYPHGSVQQSMPLRFLKNDIKHMSGEPLKNHANISSAKNKAFKKGDILMRRVGGTPQKGKYGTVGETFYIEEDSPTGETFNAPSKYNRP